MGVVVLFLVLAAAWVVTFVIEVRDFRDIHPGVNADGVKTQQPWHAELEVPQLALAAPPPPPRLPQFTNNSGAYMAQYLAEESEREALFTMDVVRKNLSRSGLLITLAAQRHGPGAEH